MADFKLAEAEFGRQAQILEALLETIELVGQQDETSPTVIAGKPVEPLPPGGQNTMAAAAVVLLAAHFEEYIRQQIEEFAKSTISEYAHMDRDQQEKLVDHYWRAGSGRMGRIRPKGDPAWASGAQRLLLQLLEYPIRQNISAFIAGMLAEHENNMRWDTITELTARVGAQKLADKLFKSSALKAQIGNPKKDAFAPAIRLRLNEFYTMRNEIVHSISQSSGIGPTIFRHWIDFFKTFSVAFADAVEACYVDFADRIKRNKEKLASAGT
ncbi:HEPN domain-containing protein [Aminobacter sp. MDW-2]|uniref:HEPN domain-containing protein n=1 Tax=Aminobacter sp. MDW-2 TaxID=2666139 RepID=UPI0012AFCC69|nr:HEPN domain-containing protein [Aminobacter sp. MDW-2]MRX33841.1 hypothetical protein [Aminobacter sp. MDW-2]QNH34119.1 hypothetical protein H5P29_27310 [Aminobacter sp. MDW-2]